MKNKFFLLTVAISFIAVICMAQDSKTETVTDVDGNVYHTVIIGTQTWLLENLKTTKYNDGTPIPNVTDDLAWRNLTTGAYCIYKNSASNNTKYGKLYNWHAVNTGMLAPTGWRVPTSDDWTTLNNYVSTHTGISGTVGKALATNTIWSDYSFAATIGNDRKKNNSTGFNAMPGGVRVFGGDCRFWSSTEYDTYLAGVLGINKYTKGVNWYIDINKEEGLSVRYIKD